ncbi:MAG: Rod shape-determining protein RodA [Microgenomates group bacterium GW2011_GWC1_43_11]|uniref:Rod shape-determining protein RodA n=2 Tax=Candidatus Gottesmaniibacteriota TaxID=1752720 RepID=A0A0G1IPK9_9BACT|nr:MAG: Rod shape-determining protein RodA [Microgenomates group bacterium GW2011_GWC1_43_11]KKT36989.1 MAG: Rod shape-determining protein RodA [Candidatus Gottesmanbacteria bacterium GW2011_GWB1_44_11c]KKT60903.1 MAG: Rod shape-determining protein RodA [Candidatus Gottesmanbacteria bacterium GW2011_GWA1_44_24b]HCM82503.1 rod shape-determining protein RodA [Patescibacteria group bacterium]
MGRFLQHLDIKITFLLLAIGVFGLGIILTINTTLFFQQLLFFILGIILLVMCSSLDKSLLYFFSPVFYVIGTLFLSLSYLGPNIRGATRWIMIGNTQLQPSELVKPLILLGLSYCMAKYPPRTLKNMFLHVILFLVPFLLIFKQPDLGSSIVYGIMWVAMLIAGGLPIPVFFVSIVSMALALPLFWRVLAPYQQARIITFLTPMSDPSGAGYNALQSMIAVGSGQVFGKGLGLGTQSHLRFLPEYHTDFIFGTLVEELGFTGGAFLLVLYALVLWQVAVPFLRQEIASSFVFIYATGLLFLVLSQIVINAGMNMGIVPITGITLPLVSYGGSSLLSVMSSFGIFIALKRTSSGADRVAIDLVA